MIRNNEIKQESQNSEADCYSEEILDEDNRISVIMGVYNCEDTIAEAIHSIQRQTYKNWEMIICDDGSDDHTVSVIKNIITDDNRIILLQNETNLGLNRTLNRCLSSASGKYIARMDGDDTCDPERFIKQLTIFEDTDDYAICGTWMMLFDKDGVWGGKHVSRNTPLLNKLSAEVRSVMQQR